MLKPCQNQLALRIYQWQPGIINTRNDSISSAISYLIPGSITKSETSLNSLLDFSEDFGLLFRRTEVKFWSFDLVESSAKLSKQSSLNRKI